jgi:hypothetical protein
MICNLSTVEPDGPVYRLARIPDPWAYPDWSQANPDGTFGNRWHDPEATYRVLYASSSRFGTLLETLARFRPDLTVVAELREIEGDGDPTPAGSVPEDWFARRLIGTAELRGVYADIGGAASLAVLRARLAARAIHHGRPDIDAAAVRLAAPRRFTQEVSRLVYECEVAHGEPFAGIRYYSRLDDATANWAIFEPGPALPLPFQPYNSTARALTNRMSGAPSTCWDFASCGAVAHWTSGCSV